LLFELVSKALASLRSPAKQASRGISFHLILASHAFPGVPLGFSWKHAVLDGSFLKRTLAAFLAFFIFTVIKNMMIEHFF